MMNGFPTYPDLNPAAGKHLFVSDLDGTFLDNFARVSTASARIVSELSHRGALISFATARTPATVDPLLAHTFTAVPVVVMTGAAEWNRAHRRFVRPAFISPEATAAALEGCRGVGLSPFIYILPPESNTLCVYHNGAMSAKEEKFFLDRSNLLLKRFILDDPAGLAGSFSNCMLILAMGPPAMVFPLADKLRRSAPLSVSAYTDNYNPSAAILEILAPDVDKATAVMRLKMETGAEKLTVFGDNLNDLSMMAVADTSVAVANAVPRVLDAADVIIGPNTEDSVARYILEALTAMNS